MSGFPVLLRQLREDRGMSMVRLARASAVSPGYVSRLEAGHRQPAREVVERLAAAMRPQYTCAICGAKFTSYNPNPTYCSRACKYEGASAPIDVSRLAALYAAGHSQDECATLLGVSQKSIHKAMRRHGLPTRIAAKRDQFGDKNHMWKGDEASYSAMHIRLYQRFGRVNKCAVCGTDDPAKWYDWANLTGKFQDINDYTRMCRSCHRQYDKRRREVMPSDAA